MTTTRQETIHRDVHAAAQAALTLAPTADLLTAAYALTHRIDASSKAPVAELARTADLRSQRDLITAEIIRRAGA